ncbi:MAG: hypothetical protein M3464_16050 [Chloroflexota bacterium]|nr:hypothetical protein [Chloroflexota bacterium]
MASPSPAAVTTADLVLAAATCRETLAPALDADWTIRAGDLNWTCQRTLDHVVDTLVFYAVMLATRATARPIPARDGDPAKSPAELLTIIESAAAILADVARAAPEGTRAFHPAGMTDPEGFLALGCEEILIHTDDIARGLGCPCAPPPDLVDRVLWRLFPWAPAGHEPWQTLKWVCGRVALPGRERLDPNWYWHSAPLSEWDGKVKRRAAPPAWT